VATPHVLGADPYVWTETLVSARERRLQQQISDTCGNTNTIAAHEISVLLSATAAT
jgi:hypothetical protein